MFELLHLHPTLVIIALALLVPVVAIIFGTVTTYLFKVRKAEIEASLKLEMLRQGMTAAEIKMVIEAGRSTPHSNGCC